MATRITLRDVARRCGYSTATVSLALRDSTHLPEATRQLIRRVARDMGYSPDPLLAALAAARWRGHPATLSATLALLADQQLEGEEGIKQRAETLGYRLERFNISDFPKPDRLSSVLYHRGILGLVVGQLFAPGFCEAFNWSPFMGVAASEGAFRPPIHLVMPNHFRAVQTAWDFAIGRGFKRIGLAIFDMPQALDPHDRRAAFLDRQCALPASRRLPVLMIKPWGQTSVGQSASRQAIRRWLQRHRPDAVLAFNDAFWWMLRDAGWQPPAPDSFITLWKQQPQPQWPGLLLPSDEIGRRAVDWVDSLLRTGERGPPAYPATMEIDMRWEDRA